MTDVQEFENAVANIRDYFKDFSNFDKLNIAKKAVKKLKTLFRSEKQENEYLKDLLNKGLMSEETIHSQSPPEESMIKEECDMMLKVKFLLKKCKELYDLVQEYDTPTDELIERVNIMKAKVSKAFRPYQDYARNIFEDGLLEDISNMFIKLTEKPTRLDIKDPKYALAHYVLKNNILRKKEKLGADKKPLPEAKIGDEIPLKKFGRQSAENPHKEPLNEPCWTLDTSGEKMNYYYEEILDEDKVPQKVLSDLYATYPIGVADKTVQLITRKHMIPLRSSITNLATKLNMGEPDFDIDFNYYDWTESLRSQEEFYKEICAGCLQEKKFSSQLRTHTTRLKGKRFPEMKAERLSVAKFKSGKIISSPIIRKFQISGKAPKFYSRTPSYYTKSKILQNAKVDPTAKAKLRLQIEKAENLNSPTYNEILDSRSKTQDAVVKSYIGNLKRSRIEKMERLEYVNEHEYGRGFQKGIQGHAKITIPFLNSNIIEERLVMNENSIHF